MFYNLKNMLTEKKSGIFHVFLKATFTMKKDYGGYLVLKVQRKNARFSFKGTVSGVTTRDFPWGEA